MTTKRGKTSGKAKGRAGTGPALAKGDTSSLAEDPTQNQDESFAENLVKRRHQDWREHQIEWRQLMDSFEGGPRYRNATYGPDRKGLPVRNLFRHRREYPDPQEFPNTYSSIAGYTGQAGVSATAQPYGPWPGDLGADPGATAQDDDYELRRSRTPVPGFVREVVDIHLGKIFDEEVSREAPDIITEWWKDVDGCGTSIDDYMRETVAPLLGVIGLLDVCLDHPKVPEGEEVQSQADVLRLNLNTCVASYILPENMVWWRTDHAGRYTECLVREYVDPSDRMDVDEDGNPIDIEAEDDENAEQWRRSYVRWRHWTKDGSTLYSFDGKQVIEPFLPNNFGRVPIIRLIDQKKHRTRNVGLSRYATTADLMRTYYNRDSELIMSDVLQAHPSLSGPEEYCKPDQTVTVGPGNLLPKKKHADGNGYESFEYVTPPKDPSESLRKNLDKIEDLIDRINGLTKPPGATGRGGGVVAQSGISKQLDAVAGNKILRKISLSLARAERFLAELAYLVLTGTLPTPEIQSAIVVGYPTRFELFSADEMFDGTMKIQQILASAGEAPNLERELIQAGVRQLLIGLNDASYKIIDEEIEKVMESKATIKEQMTEMALEIASDDNAMTGPGSEEQDAGEDDTGQSASTAVVNATNVVR